MVYYGLSVYRDFNHLYNLDGIVKLYLASVQNGVGHIAESHKSLHEFYCK